MITDIINSFHTFQDFIDLIRGQKFNIFDYFKFKNLKYNIISLGQNCFPRVICSFAKLKPTKIYGELSCPFDLAYYYNIDKIIELLNNNFENLFDETYFDEKEDTYINYALNINFVHDGKLTKEELISRYNKRIENFNFYLNSEKPLICVFYASSQLSEKHILDIYNYIKSKRENKKFGLVIAHNSNINFENKPKEVFLVDKVDIFNLDQGSSSWIKLMRPKYRKKNPLAEDIYLRVTDVLKKAIKESCNI